MVRANYYGEHYDERGTIGAAASSSTEIDATQMSVTLLFPENQTGQ
ncbi:MAG TPA: hypothetical protein QF611_08750 [Pseudomonadales bacterium]|jgi:hypothetical protein|nr:hypothetical protein [Pseudomonadales bacterium]MDP6316591.1 hypothetical protein [Pseudomonadales bacterium]MDP7315986.1 hypothetical protein [Pseudomonadales bacterium]HJP51103.1 hypothetical protein [Pseudomonadales bacterium]|tara:strand:+ start:6706 stop:6843 length:138 start_codon:yes stop_codon:yes gene_type:complete